MKFRLLWGRHVDYHPDDKHLPPVQRREVRYEQGAVIESDQDLTKFNGVAGDARKFELINEAGTSMGPSPFTWDRERETIEQFVERMKSINAVKPPVASLEAHSPPEVPPPVSAAITTDDDNSDLVGMTVEQLRQYAAGEEIALGKAKTKEEIIRVIAARRNEMVVA